MGSDRYHYDYLLHIITSTTSAASRAAHLPTQCEGRRGIGIGEPRRVTEGQAEARRGIVIGTAPALLQPAGLHRSHCAPFSFHFLTSTIIFVFIFYLRFSPSSSVLAYLFASFFDHFSPHLLTHQHRLPTHFSIIL